VSKKAGNQEKEIASEAFLPSLNDEYANLFNNLLDKLNQALPTNRVEIIENEIQTINNIVSEDELEKLKYIAVLHVLIDLSQQGWIFVIENKKLTLKMENSNIDDKERIRYRLSAERNAQFKTESVQSFVRMMEAPKRFGGKTISVRNLFGDPQHIINSINNNMLLCQPYIQIVSDTRDTLTGYKLSDIWRYFRYTWSIPYKTMPGRNLYYLVRDAMQPYHPIVGIFALGNSVLNLTVRDNDIGWTVDAIKTNMSRKHVKQCYEQIVGGTDGKTIISEEVRYTETETEYHVRAQQYADEIYLVQSMDILTIQPLTAFLNELRFKNILDQKKLRIILNKVVKIRGITEKVIIGGMANYNDPTMSNMTELFDRNTIKYVSIPFEEDIYTLYLKGIIECNISLKGYSKMFMQTLKELGNMIYPMGLSKNNSYTPPSVGYGRNNFSTNMNNTLEQMKRNY